MQSLGPAAIAERIRPRTIAVGGALATLLLAVATVPAGPLAADVLLLGAAALVALASGAAWRAARRLASLPLEVAPAAALGTVDGATVYRFRARLGQGRAFRDAQAEVRFAPDAGEPVALRVERLPAVACGPLTLVVRDPSGLVTGPGRFHVRVRVVSAGRTWEAVASVDASAVRPGRFGGIGVVGGRLAFDERWAVVETES